MKVVKYLLVLMGVVLLVLYGGGQLTRQLTLMLRPKIDELVIERANGDYNFSYHRPVTFHVALDKKDLDAHPDLAFHINGEPREVTQLANSNWSRFHTNDLIMLRFGQVVELKRGEKLKLSVLGSDKGEGCPLTIFIVY